MSSNRKNLKKIYQNPSKSKLALHLSVCERKRKAPRIFKQAANTKE
jgi:hypothetical protein